jgi:hypothetical protein
MERSVIGKYSAAQNVSTMALLSAASASSSALLRRIAAARSSLSSGKALVKGQRRGMALGGHHGPPPEWTGVDKVVRGYFPEDYQRT